VAAAVERPSVLVGMLHVGEPSVPRVRGLILNQEDVDVELVEIADLPEREAHERLYRTFDGADPRHHALVKVDADMELVEPRLLHAIGSLFRRHPDLDHLILGVDDWFSGKRIQGMNAWRNGTRWTSPPPELFTDLPTNTARTKLKVMDAGRPLVLHAADPTDAQAARYGLHRGLKAVVTGKASRIGRLLEVVDHAEGAPEPGRLLAVAAIGLALSDGDTARTLLDAAQADDVDLAVLAARVDDPMLCDEVRAQVESFATESFLEVSAGPGSAAGGVRERAIALLGWLRKAPTRSSEEDRQAQWRSELLALLEEDQPSRSSA
jgi:hypothetical protein